MDEVFEIIETFEENPFKPDKNKLKNIFCGLELFTIKCLNKDVEIGKYGVCIDDIYPIFEQLKKLIDDIKNKETAKITLDVTVMALTLFNGISECIKGE